MVQVETTHAATVIEQHFYQVDEDEDHSNASVRCACCCTIISRARA